MLEYPRYPMLLCFGAQKAATTWLFDVLKFDGRLVLPPIKELHFFSQVHDHDAVDYGPLHRREQVADVRAWIETSGSAAGKTWMPEALERADQGPVSDSWYAGFFKRAEYNQICVDICPSYFNMTNAGVAHAEALLPRNARFLALVRDPVDRALSQLRMHVSRGMEPREMSDLISGKRSLWTYLFNSDYKAALTRWEHYVGADRLHLILYDQISADPVAVVQQVYALMDLAPPEPDPAMFQTSFAGERLDIPRALRARLVEELRPQYDFLAARFPEAVQAWLDRQTRLIAQG